MDEHRTPATDEFYVGYLNPVPRGYARRVRAAVLALGVLVVGAAGVIAGFQADAGDGVWETEATTMTGLFVAAPYPVLMVEGERPEAPPRVVILVGAGKCGAFEPSGYCGLLGGSGAADHEKARAAAMKLFDGRLVQVRGTRLMRGSRMMIELEEGERSVTLAPDDPDREARLRPEPVAGMEATLTGRVVDPKCYFGAMKPGEGKTHRACAVRCISGGIPPALVVGDGPRAQVVLLADSHAAPINEFILPYVGDHVTLRGTLRWRNSDTALLEADLSGLRRADAGPPAAQFAPTSGGAAAAPK